MAESLNPKLVNGLHYVISEAAANGLSIGRTLIAKIIVLSEVYYYEFYDERLTNAIIVKAPYGPIPDGFSECLDSLESKGKIRKVRTSNPVLYESLVDCDMSGFSSRAQEMLSFITKIVGNNFTAQEMSNWLHKSVIWQVADMGEELPLVGLISSEMMPLDPDALQRLRTELSNPETFVDLDA